MELNGDAVRLGISIPLDDFADLARDFRRVNQEASRVEALGRALAEADFRSDAAQDFVRETCRWYGDSGAGERILGLNTADAIVRALRIATQLLRTDAPDIAEAFRYVNVLQALDDCGLASAHLRFLEPRQCPVFDAGLLRTMAYSLGPCGYAAYAADCMILAKGLNARGVASPLRDADDGWFASDAGAAVGVWVARWRSG